MNQAAFRKAGVVPSKKLEVAKKQKVKLVGVLLQSYNKPPCVENGRKLQELLASF